MLMWEKIQNYCWMVILFLVYLIMLRLIKLYGIDRMISERVYSEFYVRVTVIITNFFIIKPTRCTNFTNLFWHETLLWPSSGVYSLYTQQWYMSYGFVDSFWAGTGWNCSSILVLLKSCVYSACMTHTIAECKVNKLLMMDRRTVRNM
jgi:hypothetical protein